MMKDITLLTNLPVFAEFNTHELEIINNHIELKSYKKGEIIEKNIERTLFIVLKGKLISTLIKSGNIKRRHIEYSVGDLFGEISLFGFKSPIDVYHVHEDSEILFIHEKNLIELIEKYSNTAVKLLSRIISQMVQKLRDTSKFLADVVQWGENASRRVITDELTGVYNRSFLEDAIENFFNMSKSNNKPLSLLMLDIDNFRMINDNLGHETGNSILKKIVNIIYDTISRYGILTRYGGDEFSILLPETDLKKALEIAEQIRKAVETYNFTSKESEKSIPVEISIGISSFPDTATDINVFKEKADSALYKAKESGRNRVAYIE